MSNEEPITLIAVQLEGKNAINTLLNEGLQNLGPNLLFSLVANIVREANGRFDWELDLEDAGSLITNELINPSDVVG